jgi:hypothetical protein
MSALKSGLDRQTAWKYLKHPERLSQPRPARDWRTRADPLAATRPASETPVMQTTWDWVINGGSFQGRPADRRWVVV